MRKYPKYKTIGLDGFEYVPEDWQIIKLKFIAKIYNGQDQKDVLDENGQYPIYGSGGIFGYANTYLFEGPSVLLGRKGTVNKPRLVETPFWSVDTAYYTKISKKVAPILFYHLCNQINFDYFIYGSAVPSMTARDLNEIKFALPPLPEQHSIVQFLDHKTGQIDRFIANRQKQIELLKEQKAAIINKAVTKGINPNAKMKNSGIEWIGDIPEGWETLALKKCIRLLTDYEANGSFESVKQNVFFTEGVGFAAYVRATDLENKNYNDFEKLRWVNEATFKFLRKTSLEQGDVLVAKRGEIGKVYQMPILDFPCTLAPNLYLLKTNKKITPEYLFLLLSSDFGRNQLIQNDFSTTLGAIYKDDIKSMLIILPPTEIQKAVMSYIKDETYNIDTLISKYQKQIDLMQEYRTVLISQAVTGKIDVRDWKPKTKKYKAEEMHLRIAAEKPETYN